MGSTPLGRGGEGDGDGERIVKYADGPTVEVDILVEASIESVWALASDIELPARFSSEFLGARWIDVDPKVGARFAGRNHHDALGEWETTAFVARYEPLLAFEWAISDPDTPSASWWFELYEEPGGTRLLLGMRIGPAASGLSIAIEAMPDKEEKIIARRLAEHERNMQATLEGIKHLAETQP